MLPKEPLNLKVSKSSLSLVPVKSSCWVNSEGEVPQCTRLWRASPSNAEQVLWWGCSSLPPWQHTYPFPLDWILRLHLCPGSRVLLVSFQPKYQMHWMAREDILDVLWPSQVTANSIFMGSLRQNNPFGNPDVCLVFTSSFERSCLGSSSASGHPPGTVGTVPSWLGQSAVFSYCKSQTHDEWLEGLFLSQTHGKQQVPLTLQYSR